MYCFSSFESGIWACLDTTSGEELVSVHSVSGDGRSDPGSSSGEKDTVEKKNKHKLTKGIKPKGISSLKRRCVWGEDQATNTNPVPRTVSASTLDDSSELVEISVLTREQREQVVFVGLFVVKFIMLLMLFLSQARAEVEVASEDSVDGEDEKAGEEVREALPLFFALTEGEEDLPTPVPARMDRHRRYTKYHVRRRAALTRELKALKKGRSHSSPTDRRKLCRKAHHAGLRCRCDGHLGNGHQSEPAISPILSPVSAEQLARDQVRRGQRSASVGESAAGIYTITTSDEEAEENG